YPYRRRYVGSSVSGQAPYSSGTRTASKSLSAEPGVSRRRTCTGRCLRRGHPSPSDSTSCGRASGGTCESAMRAVDTNVLVRLVTRDDAKQVKAAEAFVAKGAWVPHLALVEAVWVLTAVYALEASEVATAVDMLLNHRDLTLQDSDTVRTALAHYRPRPRLGFSDCLMRDVTRTAGPPPLGTFDRGLGRLDGAERL